jgi:histidine triad (HIT) family protein
MSDCIFCKIIKGEIPAKFIYRDKNLVAFHDINPKAPVHVLVVPVKHLESLNTINGEEESLGLLMVKIKDIARELAIDKSGYKLVINNGKGAGQLVPHLHIHLLGGWRKIEGWEV